MFNRKIAKVILSSALVLFFVGCETTTTKDGETVISTTTDSSNKGEVLKKIDFLMVNPDKTSYQGKIEYYNIEDIDFNFLKKTIGSFEKGKFTITVGLNEVLPEDEALPEDEVVEEEVVEEEDVEAEDVEAEDEVVEEEDEVIVSTLGSLKKTGQMLSYDENGTEDPSIKDDGFYQAGLERTYIREKGVVTDEVTGYIWEDSYVSKKYNQEDALSYCKNLNAGDLSGWTLPSVHELQSLAVYSKVSPAVDDVFENFVSGIYWTRDIRQDEKGLGFIIDFYEGRVASNLDKATNNVRCVKIK